MTTWTVNGTELCLSADSLHGGAINFLYWRGFQFINTTDLGRELQTAYALDDQGEAQNPTEAGSSAGVPSQIINAGVSGKTLTTNCHPAYWSPYQGATFSPDTISKTVVVDYRGQVNVIRHHVIINITQPHTSGTFEILTGYLDGSLTELMTLSYDRAWQQLPYTPSVTFNQALVVHSATPLALSQVNGGPTFGIYSPLGGYWAWMGAGGNSNKIDAGGCSFSPLSAGLINRVVYYVVGEHHSVRLALIKLMQDKAH